MSIAIEPDPVVEKKLEALTAKTGRAKADYLREAIARGLEDRKDIHIADAVYRGLEEGAERTCSPAETRRELGLDD